MAPRFPFSTVPSHARRVLVVDGNRDAAESFAMLIESCGLEACAANGWEEALAAIRVFRPSLAFLEILMSEMNGCDLAARIRELPEGKNIRLIALTVLDSHEDRRIIAEAGFEYHFLKPISLDDLEELLAALNQSIR